jgi:hypothetical protein
MVDERVRFTPVFLAAPGIIDAAEWIGPCDDDDEV